MSSSEDMMRQLGFPMEADMIDSPSNTDCAVCSAATVAATHPADDVLFAGTVPVPF